MKAILSLPAECQELCSIVKDAKYVIHVDSAISCCARQSVDYPLLRELLQSAYYVTHAKAPPLKFALLLQCIDQDLGWFVILKQVPYDVKAPTMVRYSDAASHSDITRYLVSKKQPVQ